MPAKTQREREAAQRKEKLDHIKQQVDDGSLVIRQMTDEERARFPAPTHAEDRRKASSRFKRRRRPVRPLPPAPRPAA